jgi:hypothetical protein
MSQVSVITHFNIHIHSRLHIIHKNLSNNISKKFTVPKIKVSKSQAAIARWLG